MSAQTFTVGEIAVIYAPGSVYHSIEVTIIEGLHWYVPAKGTSLLDGDPAQGYTVASAMLPPYPYKEGRGWAVRRENLRKRHPPPNWRSIAARDDLIAHEKRPARIPHPVIAGILALVGQELAP